MGYGAIQPDAAVLVVTHAPPQKRSLERELGMRFTFGDVWPLWSTRLGRATHGDVVKWAGATSSPGGGPSTPVLDELRIHSRRCCSVEGRHSSNQARARLRQTTFAIEERGHLAYERSRARPASWPSREIDRVVMLSSRHRSCVSALSYTGAASCSCDIPHQAFVAGTRCSREGSRDCRHRV